MRTRLPESWGRLGGADAPSGAGAIEAWPPWNPWRPLPSDRGAHGGLFRVTARMLGRRGALGGLARVTAEPMAASPQCPRGSRHHNVDAHSFQFDEQTAGPSCAKAAGLIAPVGGVEYSDSIE
mmetsp:Transcript_23499/g.51412  ORF Transcript_23499/g.51412 Transcript_23499/m.51412 type:complete len:123 (+) Transcript_23499:186-554(+)